MTEMNPMATTPPADVDADAFRAQVEEKFDRLAQRLEEQERRGDASVRVMASELRRLARLIEERS